MLTPLDIDNKSFKKVKFGGYEINDVEEFLIVVMEDYEKLYKENAELKDKACAMQESVSYYKSVEEGINKTLENAQSQADNIKEVAIRDAESIKKEQELDATRNLEELKLEIKRAEIALEEKKKQMNIYKIRIGSMLEAQLQILNEDNEANL
ncbi:MAG: DivIVA domain-containing protein [Clostridia bacterium]